MRSERRLALAAVAAWATAGWCVVETARASVAVMAAAASVAVAVRRSPVAVMIAIGVMAAAGSSAWHLHRLASGPVATLARARADAEVRAKLVRDPDRIVTSTGTTMTITDATVTSVLANGWRRTNAPVVVMSFGAGWAGLLPGQVVDVSGRFVPPQHGDGTTAAIEARAPPILIGRPPWWQRLAGRVRAGLRDACGGLPADARGLLPSLVDGDSSRVPPSLQSAMRVTGLTHLEAVSGENVSVVLTVVLAIARSMGVRRRSRAALCLAALLAFVVVARPSPSVLRAAVTGGVVLLAMVTGRRAAALPALSLAVAVLAVVNPFLARSVGFALSVVATGSLVLLAPHWTRRLERHLPHSLAVAVAVPAAAQLACTPILLLAFGQLTPYAVIANLLAAPAVVPATILGVATALVALVWLAAAIPFAWLGAVPTTAIAVVARGIARFPGAALDWHPNPAAVVGMTIAAAVVLRRRLRRRAVTS